MASFRQHVEAVINNDRPNGGSALAHFLFLSSKCYGLAARLKNVGINKKWLSSYRLPCPVISIGNLTSGGTGKTPLTLYIARLISKWGYRVAIVSRGYKGSLEKTGGVVSDGKKILMASREAGDEPFMMAKEVRNIPVIVGKNRFESARKAIAAFSSNVIILDDGFQHRKLNRQIDLLLVDHGRGFGNHHLLPRGPLREPLSAIKRAHAIIETRAELGSSTSPDVRQAVTQHQTDCPVFQCEFKPHIAQVIAATTSEGEKTLISLKALPGMRVFGFSGLANNSNFQQTLKGLGCRIAGFQEFPDHFWYNETDVRSLQKAAIDLNAEIIVTTQKDFIRIHEGIKWPLKVAVFSIEPHFGSHTKAFHHFIKERLTKDGNPL
jgi:tetraacyldisaccharide 4'-kinase